MPFLPISNTSDINRLKEVANNIKKQGGFIPGIRPGKPTSDYLEGPSFPFQTHQTSIV